MTPVEVINYARWAQGRLRHVRDEAAFTEPALVVYRTKVDNQRVDDNQNAGGVCEGVYGGVYGAAGTIDRFVRLLLVVGHILWLSQPDSVKRFSLLELS